MFVVLFIVIAIGAAVFFNSRRRLNAQIRTRETAEQALVDVTETLGCGVYQLHQMADGVITLVFANPAARRFAGLPANGARLCGDDIVGRLHSDDCARIMRAASHSMRTGAALSEACRLRLADGAWAWIVNDASARHNADGSRSWSGFMKDLTAEKTLNQSLRELLQQKREFVVTAGQELRAPIHTLSLAAQSLLSRELTGAQAHSLARVSKVAQYLGKYVDGLLQLSRLDAGEDFIDSRPVDLRRTLAEVISSLREDSGFEDLNIRYQEAESLPDHAYLDADRFKRLMGCLIESTAIDRPGRQLVVQVELSSAPTNQSDGAPALANSAERPDCWLRLKTLVPQQAGDADDSDERVVSQDDAALALRSQDLAIARRLISGWGGVFDPSQANGAEIICSVVLPLRLATARQVDDYKLITVRKSAVGAGADGTRHSPAVAFVRPVRILFVDDDKASRILLASMLREEGFEVTEADNAERGLERLAGGDVDVVILDNQMPGMSGIEMAGQIRRTRAGGDCPFLIGVTGGILDQELDVARLAFDRLLIKPVNVAGLLTILQGAVRRPQGREQHA